jgi:hypothetical protein
VARSTHRGDTREAGVTALSGRVRAPTVDEVARYSWFAAAAAYVFVMTVSAYYVSWDFWAALVFAPILFAITIPLLKRGLRKNPDPRIGRIVVIAFVAKMLGSVARYVLTYGLYERADAEVYHVSGSALAEGFWNNRFAQVMELEVPQMTGTPFIKLATGVLYILTGPTELGGFIVFSWLSFLGLFFFYKAVVVGFPEANHRRYAYLVFFLPSMLYWPSSVGKEAWISFGLGLASYGIALITRHQALGYPVAALGLLATAGPRPHITVLCVVSLMIAYLLRRKSWRASTMGPVGKVVGLVVLMGVGAVVVTTTASFFELDEVSTGSVTEVLDYTDQQSGQGGSEFEPVRVKSPTEFPSAVLAVLFRPFPWEANSAQALIASAEGILLLILGTAMITRLMRLPKYIFQVPYVAYAASYTMMFVIAFSSIGNFGILTRQRTQVLPLMLVLLVLPYEHAPAPEPTPTVEERARELARATRRPRQAAY